MTLGPASSEEVGRALRPQERSCTVEVANATGGTGWLLRPSQVVFRLVATSLFLQMTVSSNLLYVLHIPYDVPGGLPLFKLHPSTYLIGFALLIALLRDGQPTAAFTALHRKHPGLDFFGGAMCFCTIFSLISVGVSGAAIWVETYLSAWCLAVVMGLLSTRQLRSIGVMLLWTCVANVIVALIEAITQHHLVPIYLVDQLLVEPKGEFRPTAGFDHPLTAAMVTMMGVFLLMGAGLSRRLKVIILPVLLVGLLAFGGRTALAVTSATLIAIGAMFVARSILNRTLSFAIATGTLAIIVITPIALTVLLTTTTIGERIAARFYFDSSAQGRTLQWMALTLLDAREIWFGTPLDRLPQLAFLLGLQMPFEDFENPWLLDFLHLGVIGFIPFILGLIPLLVNLWRRVPLFGRLMIVDLLVVTSTSNSLGRKSNVLFLLVAFLLSTRHDAWWASLQRPSNGVALEQPPIARGLRTMRCSSIQPSIY